MLADRREQKQEEKASTSTEHGYPPFEADPPHVSVDSGGCPW